MVRIACLDDVFLEIFELQAIPVDHCRKNI